MLSWALPLEVAQDIQRWCHLCQQCQLCCCLAQRSPCARSFPHHWHFSLAGRSPAAARHLLLFCIWASMLALSPAGWPVPFTNCPQRWQIKPPWRWPFPRDRALPLFFPSRCPWPFLFHWGDLEGVLGRRELLDLCRGVRGVLDLAPSGLELGRLCAGAGLYPRLESDSDDSRRLLCGGRRAEEGDVDWLPFQHGSKGVGAGEPSPPPCLLFVGLGVGDLLSLWLLEDLRGCVLRRFLLFLLLGISAVGSAAASFAAAAAISTSSTSTSSFSVSVSALTAATSSSCPSAVGVASAFTAASKLSGIGGVGSFSSPASSPAFTAAPSAVGVPCPASTAAPSAEGGPSAGGCSSSRCSFRNCHRCSLVSFFFASFFFYGQWKTTFRRSRCFCSKAFTSLFWRIARRQSHGVRGLLWWPLTVAMASATLSGRHACIHKFTKTCVAVWSDSVMWWHGHGY